jgi:serine/threonine protein kinase
LGSEDDSSDEEEIAKAVCLARENTQIGSPLYISPEMLKYQIACFGSDLWALGCIIYECIVGHPPFTGKNKFEIEDKISD